MAKKKNLFTLGRITSQTKLLFWAFLFVIALIVTLTLLSQRQTTINNAQTNTCSQYSAYCTGNSCNWSPIHGTAACGTIVTGYYRDCLGSSGDLTTTVNAICGFTNPSVTPSACSQYTQYCDQNGSCNWSTLAGNSQCSSTVTGYYRNCLGATGDLTTTVNSICSPTPPACTQFNNYCTGSQCNWSSLWNTPQCSTTVTDYYRTCLGSSGDLTSTLLLLCRKPGDVDKNGKVEILDLSRMLSFWGLEHIDADFDISTKVDLVDLSILLANWGK